ncbi:DUF4158 domain-containing protein [Nonomuraea sp. NPDC050451]|uniref:DUF4158 domain-containing protein n=1 Tax=Nonomuraea sp. NPDC050451 TaxID=3364364 RepID=UPI0037AB7089
MTWIERTAYPQFKRLTSARVLHVFFTPSPEEVDWAEQRTGSPESCFALVLALKCFQKMARFPSWDEIPEVVIDHVRRCLELAEDVWPGHGSSGSAKAHRKLVRQRQDVKYDAGRARAIAAVAIRKAAQAKNNPADLINAAIEELLRLRLELLGYTTLEDLATSVRAEVNAAIFATILRRMGEAGRARMEGFARRRAGRQIDVQRSRSPPSGPPGRGYGIRCRGWIRWTRSATPTRGWTASRRGRSPTSRERPTPRTPTPCRATTRSSRWRCWPA